MVAGAGPDGPGGSSAPLTIAADGRRSRLARALGLARHAPRPRRWAIGAYFDDVAGMTRSARCTSGAAATSASRRCPADLPTSASSPPTGRGRGPAGRPAGADGPRPITRWRTGSRARGAVTAPAVPRAARGRLRCGRGARPAARRRRGRFHRSDDRRRAALRPARRRARRGSRRCARSSTVAPTRTSGWRERAGASSPRKWRFNRTLRSLVGSPLAVRAAALGARWLPRWLHRTIRYAGDLRAA